MAESNVAENDFAPEIQDDPAIPAAPAPLWRTVLRWTFKLGLPVAIFAFLFGSGRLKPEDLKELALRWNWTLAAMVLFIPSVLACAMRFKLLLKAFDVHTSFRENISLSMIGMLFDLIAPVSNGGDVVKAVYLSRPVPGVHEKRSLKLILFSVFIDRIVGMFSLFVLALIVSIIAWPQIEAHPNLRKMTLIVAVVCIGFVLGFFVMVSEKLENSPLRKRLMHILPFHEKLEKLYAGFAGLRHHKRILVSMLGLSLINHACNCFSIMILAHGTAFTYVAPPHAPVTLDFIPTFTVLPLAMFLNTFGFAGGFGVGTVAIDVLFRSILGVAGGVHLALLFQITALLFRLLGIPFFIFYKHNDPNKSTPPGVK